MVTHVAARSTHASTLLFVSLAALGGGISMWAAFPFTSIWWLSYIGMMLLMWSVFRRALWLTLWASFLWGSAFMVPLTSWAHISIGWVGPWMALAGIQIAFMMCWAIGAAVASRISLMQHWLVWSLFASVTFAGMEQLRGRYPFGGFPWGYLAYSQVDAPLGNLAHYIGEAPLSFLTAFIGACAAGLFSARHRGAQLLMQSAYGCLALLVATLPVLVPPTSTTDSTNQKVPHLRVAIIQGNVDRPVEQTYATPMKVLDNHIHETLSAFDTDPDIDLFLWGEQASDIDYRNDEAVMKKLADLGRQVHKPIVFGSVQVLDNDAGKRVRHNDLSVLLPDGTINPVYTKRFPVAFGEYIPMRDFLGKYFSDVKRIPTDMEAGKDIAPVIDVAGTQLAAGICFEVAIDSLIGEGIDNGGTFIVVPTNNSSFGFSAQSQQQLDIARFRARTYGRSIIQVSTNGVSALVGPDGRIIEKTPLFTNDSIIADVPTITHTTVGGRLSAPAGTVCAYATLAGWLIIIVMVFVARRNTPRRYHKGRKK
ncbi:MAG: apolipoprotein N-acyltransferase [Actinomycetaceae bacterium]|nr:apolipoprotein N-acyltransferase [Actinomycetaceae bacterium]